MQLGRWWFRNKYFPRVLSSHSVPSGRKGKRLQNKRGELARVLQTAETKRSIYLSFHMCSTLKHAESLSQKKPLIYGTCVPYVWKDCLVCRWCVCPKVTKNIIMVVLLLTLPHTSSLNLLLEQVALCLQVLTCCWTHTCLCILERMDQR